MAAGGRALLRASMLLCPLRPGSASGEPRGHGRAGPSAALQPGGNATSSSSSVAAASNPRGPSPPLPLLQPHRHHLLLLVSSSPRAFRRPRLRRGGARSRTCPAHPPRGPTPASASQQELGGPAGVRYLVVRAKESSSPNSSRGGHSPTRFTPRWPPSRQNRPGRPLVAVHSSQGARARPGVREKLRAEFLGGRKGEGKCPRPTILKGIAFPRHSLEGISSLLLPHRK